MAEIEELIKTGKLQLDEIQKECLTWKGRALGAVPALKVALAALARIQTQYRPTLEGGYWYCIFCGEVSERHMPDCEREVAIKVLREAIG